MKRRIALSIGCPSGIGPEISVAAAPMDAPILLVGDYGVIEQACALSGVDRARLRIVRGAREAYSCPDGTIAVLQPGPRIARHRFGRPNAQAGREQLRWIATACDIVADGQADALVTGPVSKEWVARSGAPGAKSFRGHTEYLQSRLGAREVVMAFVGKRMVCSLATTHVPLARVPRVLSPSAVASAVFHTAMLATKLRAAPSRTVVCALNPHAGEDGLLGDEERTSIRPGIARARRRLTLSCVPGTVDGPLGAETALRLTMGGHYDAAVAMYHDQATIAMKLLEFGDAVNVSLGLPIVRTSVDHGTAYDVAGTGACDAESMKRAIDVAARLVSL